MMMVVVVVVLLGNCGGDGVGGGIWEWGCLRVNTIEEVSVMVVRSDE